jgi:VWFA-related protein
MNSLVRHFPIWHVLLAFVLLAPVRILAQVAPDAGQRPASETAAPNAPQYQLKLPVPLVIEDVVVLDSKEQPVHGLLASDFIVTESGKPVELRNFEEHVPPSAPGTLVKTPPLGANIFTNAPEVPPSTSLNIFLLDALNTPITAQAFVREQMLQFLKGLAPGTRVAIFGLGMRLQLLQGFTDDPAVLRAAIEHKNGPESSALLGRRTSEDPSNPADDSVLAAIMNRTNNGQAASSALQSIAAHEAAAATRERTIYTLQAMNQLARYLAVLPGHKNLIWFSGSFPFNILPNDQLSDPYALVNNFRDAMRQTADMMARGRIAVYPVDARGLMPDSSMNTAQYGMNRYAEVHNHDAAEAAAKHLASDQTYAEHDTMVMMAAYTGGMAFYNSNGLKDATDKILRYGENYYTIAYSPTNRKFDGSYRKIAIRSNQRDDLRIIYRVGYYADDPDALPSGKKVLPLSAMQTAMLHGVPNAIQVRFDSAFIPGEKPGDKLTPGGNPDASRMRPPYMSYMVQFIVDIRSVQFTMDANKVHHGSLELASFVYDRDGVPVNSTISKVSLDLPDERFAQIAQQGVLTRQTIEAPAGGEHYLRVGICDLSNDHVGALEVPLTSLKSLQELRSEAANKNAGPAQ